LSIASLACITTYIDEVDKNENQNDSVKDKANTNTKNKRRPDTTAKENNHKAMKHDKTSEGKTKARQRQDILN
jgi:hypothetical protein